MHHSFQIIWRPFFLLRLNSSFFIIVVFLVLTLNSAISCGSILTGYVATGLGTATGCWVAVTVGVLEELWLATGVGVLCVELSFDSELKWEYPSILQFSHNFKLLKHKILDFFKNLLNAKFIQKIPKIFSLREFSVYGRSFIISVKFVYFLFK